MHVENFIIGNTDHCLGAVVISTEKAKSTQAGVLPLESESFPECCWSLTHLFINSIY